MLKPKNVVSFSVAYAIMIRLLSVTALTGYGSGNLNLLILLVLFLSFGMSLIMNRKRFQKNSNKWLFVALVLILSMYCIHLLAGKAQITVLELSIYCLIPLILSITNFDAELVLRYILYLSLFSLPVLNNLLQFEYVTLQQIDMAVAYALFVGVAAFVIHFFFYRKEKEHLLVYVAYLYNAYMLLRIIFVGNRGIYLSLASLVLLCQITYVRGKNYSRKKRRIWRCILILEIIVAIILILNLNTFVLALYDNLSSSGQTIPSFIIKMRRQILAGDVSNGRASGYLDLIQVVLDNPFGYGMESTYRVTNGVYAYPHNFILQFWIEYGIFVGTLLNVIVCMPIYVWFSKKAVLYRHEKNFLLFLIAITIPKMMISGDIWMQPQFWVLFGMGVLYCTDFVKIVKFRKK